MDLTQLTHYLIIGCVSHVIDEPVGFDGLKTTIKRGDYHGISAEVSVGTLEFYNSTNYNAATLIRNAYNADIDTEVTYKVMWQTEVVYTGVVDLSTYSESSGNATKISCKVGEIGVKTTFNNRTETEVDLNRATTMSGEALAHIPKWQNLEIPAKTIMYKNTMTQPETVVHDKNDGGDTMALHDEFQWSFIGMRLDKTNINEFGSFEPNLYCAKMNGTLLDGYVEPLFKKEDDFDKRYGAGSTYDLDVYLKIRIKFSGDVVTPRTNTPYFQINSGVYKPQIAGGMLIQGTRRYVSNDGGQYSIGSGSYQTRDTDKGTDTLEYVISGFLTECTEDKLYIGFYMYNMNGGYNNPTPFTVEIVKGSYIRMELNSKKKTEVSADMLFVHEAFNKIVEIISDNKLHVKSDWYGRLDSIVYPKSNAVWDEDQTAFKACVGGGALKAITNGYKIRGLYSDYANERNMPLSFKDMIEAMDALDCIGWGFVEENGQIFVRVERWDWFYRNNVVLVINDPNEKTQKVDNDRIITSLNIGYKKYTTNENYNSNDNFHSERTFTSNTSAVAKDVSKLCKFIADNYAIEETRRAKDDIDATEEFKYDENIFVFGIRGKRGRQSRSMTSYDIPCDIASCDDMTLNYYSEFYNALLSPTRCAMRWVQRIFCVNGLKPLLLTSGKVNYKSTFTAKHDGVTQNVYNFYLDDSMKDIPLLGVIVHDEQWGDDAWQEDQTGESMDIRERYYTQMIDGVFIPDDVNDKIFPRIAKAETLKIKYPLTIPQYKSVKADPYGLIQVDGKLYWLKEMTFAFKSGETELTLIPKA